jgi:hypothetical protein
MTGLRVVAAGTRSCRTCDGHAEVQQTQLTRSAPKVCPRNRGPPVWFTPRRQYVRCAGDEVAYAIDSPHLGGHGDSGRFGALLIGRAAEWIAVGQERAERSR